MKQPAVTHAPTFAPDGLPVCAEDHTGFDELQPDDQVEAPALLLHVEPSPQRCAGPVKCHVVAAELGTLHVYEGVFPTTWDAAIDAMDRFPAATRIRVWKRR